MASIPPQSGHRSGHHSGQNSAHRLGLRAGGIGPIAKLQQLYRLVRESHAEPITGEPGLPPAVTAGQTAITFIGHSSFLVQLGGHALLIDPVFATRLILLRRQRRPGLRVRDLPPIHAILLTHAHMDHLNRPSLRAVCREMRRRRLPAPVAIVPNGVGDLVGGLGFSAVTELRWWDSTELAPGQSPAATSSHATSPHSLRITATPARHWGARLFRDTHRGFGGYALELLGNLEVPGNPDFPGDPAVPRLYHSGDTAYFAGFAEIGRRLAPTIALLPIGAYSPDSYRAVHTSPEEALRAFQDLGSATTLVPMHYNTFRLGREPMTEPLPRLLTAAARAGLQDRMHPLAEGESLVLEPSSVRHPEP